MQLRYIWVRLFHFYKYVFVIPTKLLGSYRKKAMTTFLWLYFIDNKRPRIMSQDNMFTLQNPTAWVLHQTTG